MTNSSLSKIHPFFIGKPSISMGHFPWVTLLKWDGLADLAELGIASDSDDPTEEESRAKPHGSVVLEPHACESQGSGFQVGRDPKHTGTNSI